MALCALLPALALASGPYKTTDSYGNPVTVHDFDGDGWDDLWVDLHYGQPGRPLPASKKVDTDRDGKTDYQEMLDWRNPLIAGPHDKDGPTEEELADSERLAAVRKQAQLDRWTRLKADFEPIVSHRLRFLTTEERLAKNAQEKDREYPPIDHDRLIPQGKHAGEAMSADALWPGGYTGLNLLGSGVNLIQLEAKAPYMHTKLLGRLNTTGATEFSNHATNVAGMMISEWGGGTFPDYYTGTAPDAKVYWYDGIGFTYPGVFSSADFGFTNAPAINYSMGQPSGWHPVEHNAWHSWPSTSFSEPNTCGHYLPSHQGLENEAIKHPRALFVTSAGNDRNLQPKDPTASTYRSFAAGNGPLLVEFTVDSLGLPPAAGANDAGYDSMNPGGTYKNALVVGAHDAFYASASFSCWGPTDDGRIKPDVTALGVNCEVLKGTNSYESGADGTSLASPAVAGAVGLLDELHESVRGYEEFYLSSTLKALMIHGALDVDEPGPDYRQGYGPVNIDNSAQIVIANYQNELHPHIKEVKIDKDDGATIRIKAPGLVSGGPGEIAGPLAPIKVTVVWHDPMPDASIIPGEETLDVSTKMLTNDVDTVVWERDDDLITPVELFKPWTLDLTDPPAAAVRGDNDRDNVEQVLIEEPTPGAVYDIMIRCGEADFTSPDNTPGYAQAVSVVITGNDPDYIAGWGNHYIERTGLTSWGVGFQTIPGDDYQVQTSVDLDSWIDEGVEFVANDWFTYLSVDTNGEDRRFWRLRTVE